MRTLAELLGTLTVLLSMPRGRCSCSSAAYVHGVTSGVAASPHLHSAATSAQADNTFLEALLRNGDDQRHRDIATAAALTGIIESLCSITGRAEGKW